MYIIEGQKGIQKWISAIFQEENKAKAFWDTIPEGLKQYQRLYQLEQPKYPLFVIEQNQFRFVDEEELQLAIHCKTSYFTYYIIAEDFAPQKPGIDYMGSLEHYHVE